MNKDDKPRIEFNPKLFNGGLDFSPESIKNTEDGFTTVNVDYATGVSYSEFTYFHISRNWLHDRYLRFRFKHKPNHVVVKRSVFDQSIPLKPDISKSIRIESTKDD